MQVLAIHKNPGLAATIWQLMKVRLCMLFINSLVQKADDGNSLLPYSVALKALSGQSDKHLEHTFDEVGATFEQPSLEDCR